MQYLSRRTRCSYSQGPWSLLNCSFLWLKSPKTVWKFKNRNKFAYWNIFVWEGWQIWKIGSKQNKRHICRRARAPGLLPSPALVAALGSRNPPLFRIFYSFSTFYRFVQIVLELSHTFSYFLKIFWKPSSDLLGTSKTLWTFFERTPGNPGEPRETVRNSTSNVKVNF